MTGIPAPGASRHRSSRTAQRPSLPRRIPRRAFAAGTLAAGLTAATTSCAPAKGGRNPDGTFDLLFTTWVGDTTVHGIWQSLADEFREQNPELGTFTIQAIPQNEHIAKMSILLQGGDAPDLSMIPVDLVGAWAQAGELYDMSALRKDPEWGYADMSPNLLDPYVGSEGQLWAYPMVNTVHPVYFNRTAYEEAGLETPRDIYEDGRWDWNALKESAAAIVESGVVPFGFDMPGFSFTAMPPYLDRAFDTEYYSPDGTCGLTEERSVQAVEFLRSMMYEDRSFKTPGTTPNFSSGDSGMVINPPSYQGQLGETDFEWDMVPQPAGVDGEFAPGLAQASIAVWAKSEAPELALRLLAHITGPRGAEAQAGTYISARTTDIPVIEKRMVELYPETDPVSISRSVFEPLSSAVASHMPIRQPELKSAVGPILNGLWPEDVDVEDVLTDACELAGPLLS